MDEHQPRNAFDIPQVFYFEVGNTHSGSRNHLRYWIEPVDNVLKITVWRADVCYEIAEERGLVAGTAEVPLSEDGFQQMIDYLQTEYDKKIIQNE